MRIIGGRLKGRKLLRPVPGVRPTTDRLRESLFNVLGKRVEGSRWVDAFAGSGAVGIEAISRGASLVIFNDRSSRVRKRLQRNLELCRITSGFELHARDAISLLRRLEARPIDFVFLDPPYATKHHEPLLRAVHVALANSSPEHLVLLEVSARTGDDVSGDLYELQRRIRAGDSHVLVLRPIQQRNAKDEAALNLA